MYAFFLQDLLEKHLLKEDIEKIDKSDRSLVEAQVFYLKMMGDYYRYLAEVAGENEDVDKGNDVLTSTVTCVAL